jgi:hypothetical protein
MNATPYISFDALVATLGLPRRYLRDLADAKRIPFLEIGNRKYFDAGEVVAAIHKLAAKAGKGADDAK